MKMLHLLSLGAAMAALPALAVTEAEAQQRPVGGGLRLPVPPPPPIAEFHTGFPGFIVVEREVPVIVEREVVREVPAAPAAAPAPPAPPRRPYVIGKSYASRPSGCMKMIEEGVSYYYCGGGEWYRQVGSRQFKAVAKP